MKLSDKVTSFLYTQRMKSCRSHGFASKSASQFWIIMFHSRILRVQPWYSSCSSLRTSKHGISRGISARFKQTKANAPKAPKKHGAAPGSSRIAPNGSTQPGKSEAEDVIYEKNPSWYFRNWVWLLVGMDVLWT
jgi:hypothetical protein